MFQLKQVQDNSVGTLNRVFQAIATALNTAPPVPQLPVKLVRAAVGTSLYSVQSNDVYIIVDSRGGPMRVSLPVPGGATQVVTVLKAYDSNSVAIVQANGKPFANAAAVITLDYNEAPRMVTDGQNWFRLGA